MVIKMSKYTTHADGQVKNQTNSIEISLKRQMDVLSTGVLRKTLHIQLQYF